MPKSSKKQIDADEKRVIRELQKSSKESIDKIAKKCGFSRQKVWRIIKRLEKNKTIWGYNAVVDNEKLGLGRYMILIKRTNAPIQETAYKIISRDIEKKADDIGINIINSCYLNGVYDWQICITADSLAYAKKFCEILNTIYHPSIKAIDLIEAIFPVKNCGIQNPNLEKLKDFL